ncbi:MAG: hypothetical protein HQL31_05880 [Planctomycetes bacterium]|nr:hypothetical protein [Planctomycetota bacterium]
MKINAVVNHQEDEYPPVGNPTIEEVRAQFGHLLQNKDVAAVSRWTEPNHDDECNEAKYRAQIDSEAVALQKMLDEIVEAI